MNGNIELVTGLLGGGKTLFSVEEIVYHLRRGGVVYTNIALRLDAIREWMASHGYEFDETRVHVFEVSEIAEFHLHVERGTKSMCVMVVIDEASLNINARDWQKLNRELWNFNVLVRKFDIRMIYISQQPEYLDKQIRGLVKNQVDCRSLKDFHLLGVIPLRIPVLIRVFFRKDFGGKAIKTHSEFIVSPRWVYPLFNSDALLGGAAEKFALMKVADQSPLKRIPRREKPTSLPLYTAVFFAAFCVLL